MERQNWRLGAGGSPSWPRICDRAAEVAALLLVLGDEQTQEQIQSTPAITIDGCCKLACASSKMVAGGGQVV
ncbi:MAG: hypothetical protein U0401_00550 [Anaerolineae bacterium]